MPTRPPEKCSTPGCPGHTADGGRCARCRGTRLFVERAGDAEVYTRRPWRARRLEYLADHPFCLLCRAPATVPDHYPVSRRVLVAAGVADPDADERLRPLCARCHNSSTARRQPGGWNRTNQE